MTFTPYEKQRQLAEFWSKNPKMLNFSGCGTGKTLGCIHTVNEHWPDARVLVLAPLTILKSAWETDIHLGANDKRNAIAYASNRKKAFESNAKWVITNHDAVKTVYSNKWHKDFDVLIVDEADVFRNRLSGRSKALSWVTQHFDILTLMTATPMPRSVTDVWNLAYQVDKGERLGRNFFGFRNQVCTPKPIFGVENAMEWVDKPEAKDLVSMMLQDITFRVELEDVAEIPQMFFHPPIKVKLPTKIRRQYDELRKHSQLLVEQGAINAVNAGARAQKMAQLLSGAVYDGEGGYVDLHTDRHKLVLDLAEEAEHSLVAFHWKHQRAGLEKEATRRGISYAVIDGSTSVKERETIIEKFKEGEYRVVFGHPLSIGHGLTLTRATRVIWASPTTRADIFEQFIHRVRRIGQDKKTEVLMITAENTIEDRTYETLVHRKETMTDYLYLVSALQQEAA